jgi:hypothetical protein
MTVKAAKKVAFISPHLFPNELITPDLYVSLGVWFLGEK